MIIYVQYAQSDDQATVTTKHLSGLHMLTFYNFPVVENSNIKSPFFESTESHDNIWFITQFSLCYTFWVLWDIDIICILQMSKPRF